MLTAMETTERTTTRHSRPPLEVAEMAGRDALATYAAAAGAGWLSDGLGPTLAISLLVVSGAMAGDDILRHAGAIARSLARAGGGTRMDPGAAAAFLRAAAQGFVSCGDHQCAADALELATGLRLG
jgi:hypothetical protein